MSARYLQTYIQRINLLIMPLRRYRQAGSRHSGWGRVLTFCQHAVYQKKKKQESFQNVVKSFKSVSSTESISFGYGLILRCASVVLYRRSDEQHPCECALNNNALAENAGKNYVPLTQHRVNSASLHVFFRDEQQQLRLSCYKQTGGLSSRKFSGGHGFHKTHAYLLEPRATAKRAVLRCWYLLQSR